MEETVVGEELVMSDSKPGRVLLTAAAPTTWTLPVVSPLQLVSDPGSCHVTTGGWNRSTRPVLPLVAICSVGARNFPCARGTCS